MSASDSGSEVAEPGQQETWEDWEDNEGAGFKSLFSDAQFGSLDEVLQHDEEHTGFSLRRYRAQHGLEQIDTIRLINYIRATVAAGQNPLPALADGEQPWRDDAHLQPVLPDDELMFHDWEEGQEQEGCAPAEVPAASPAPAEQPPAAGSGVRQLQAENEVLRGMVEAMRAVVLQDEGMRELVVEQAAAAAGAGSAEMSTSAAAAQQQALEQQEQARAAGKDKNGGEEAAQRIDDSYFDSYSTFDIHREMLADKVRTEAYRDALEKNPGLVRGARVLDVGCGTGILSMFAARGGAASVIGIDGSEQIARFAQANVEANGLSEDTGGPITIVSSKVEQLAALPMVQPADGGPQEQQHQVDVLVSEWMGYALLFESMLSSVLHARDRWLRPGGALLPDIARLFVAAAGEGAIGLDFWQDVYGFSMEAVRSSLEADALKRAVVRAVGPQHLLSEPACVHSLDLATMREEEQDFTAHFNLSPGSGPKQVHALVLWFDTLFSARFCTEHPLELSTSPNGPQTHWMQTVLLLKQPLTWVPAAAAGSAPGMAVAIAGQLSMARSKQTHRSLDIVLRYVPRYADGSSGEEQVVLYGMGVES